jgi:hypothetical protein
MVRGNMAGGAWSGATWTGAPRPEWGLGPEARRNQSGAPIPRLSGLSKDPTTPKSLAKDQRWYAFVSGRRYCTYMWSRAPGLPRAASERSGRWAFGTLRNLPFGHGQLWRVSAFFGAHSCNRRPCCRRMSKLRRPPWASSAPPPHPLRNATASAPLGRPTFRRIRRSERVRGSRLNRARPAQPGGLPPGPAETRRPGRGFL